MLRAASALACAPGRAEESVARWLVHHSRRVETGAAPVSEGLRAGRAESFHDSHDQGCVPSQPSLSTSTSMDSHPGGRGSWREGTTPSQASEREPPSQGPGQGGVWSEGREDAQSLASDVTSSSGDDDARVTDDAGTVSSAVLGRAGSSVGSGVAETGAPLSRSGSAVTRTQGSVHAPTVSSPGLLERGASGKRLQFHVFGWTSFPDQWQEDWVPLSPDTTVGDLRQVAAAKTGRAGAEAHSLLLFSHGTELLRDADRVTVRQLGFKADPAMTSDDRAVVLLDHFACMQAFSMEASERNAVPEAPRAMLAKHVYGPGLQASGIVPLVGRAGDFAAPPVPAPLVEVVMKLSDVQRCECLRLCLPDPLPVTPPRATSPRAPRAGPPWSQR